MTVDDLIRTREELNLSQGDFAKIIGQTRSYVSQIECGSRGITPAKKTEIKSALEAYLKAHPEHCTTFSRKNAPENEAAAPSKSNIEQIKNCDALEVIQTDLADAAEMTKRNNKELRNIATNIEFMKNSILSIESFKTSLQAQIHNQFLIIIQMIQVINSLVSTNANKRDIQDRLDDLCDVVTGMAKHNY